MLLRAKRRFWLAPRQKLESGASFEASEQLAERLIRRGDAEPASEPPPQPKPKRAKPPKASEPVEAVLLEPED